MSGDLIPTGQDRLVADYARQISDRWSDAVGSIVSVGGALIEAKGRLSHGAFQDMVRDSLPFGGRTARKLMAVARHPWFKNGLRESVLPPAWSTLYELSRMSEGELDAALSRGLIRPDMDRTDVALLRRPARPAPGEVPPIEAAGAGYRAILADPSWEYRTWSERGQAKSPSRHYPPMTPEEIAALPVADLAAEDAVLVLWATWPHLPQAQATIEAWGFRYVTGGSWFKSSRTGRSPAFGTGYVLRNACDPFLVATRGRPETNGSALRNAIEGAAVEGSIREHSRKPDSIYELVETLVPGGPYVELFARQRRPGWDAWGTETDKFTHQGGA